MNIDLTPRWRPSRPGTWLSPVPLAWHLGLSVSDAITYVTRAGWDRQVTKGIREWQVPS